MKKDMEKKNFKKRYCCKKIKTIQNNKCYITSK